MDKIKKLFSFRIVRSTNVGLVFEEVHLRRFLSHFKIDCVFDIGANEGQYATQLRHIGYKGDIVSCEPIPEVAEVLRAKAASDSKWHIVEAALDSVSGSKTFNIMSSNQFSSLHAPSSAEIGLFKEKNVVEKQVKVTTMTLGELFEAYQSKLGFKRPFLKMDTQGHDLEIASASVESLRSFVGLQSELSVKKIYEGAPDYKDVVEYYNSQGFEMSAFVPNNSGHFPRLIEIDCIMYNNKFSDDSQQ